MLAGVPSPVTVTRYHSLAIDEAGLPNSIEVTGRTASGVVMALRHRELPIEGVQFHPESVLTEHGHRMVANWLVSCGQPVQDDRVERLAAQMTALRLAAWTTDSATIPV